MNASREERIYDVAQDYTAEAERLIERAVRLADGSPSVGDTRPVVLAINGLTNAVLALATVTGP